MQNPADALKQMSEQMGWVGQMLGEDFWDQIQSGMKQSRPQKARHSGPGAPAPGSSPPQGGAAPPIDLYATPLEVVVCASLPGIERPEHVSVNLVSPSEVVLEAFIQPPSALGTTLHRERFAGYVARSIPLPATVSTEGVRARYTDGVLELRFKRMEAGEGSGGVSLLQLGRN